MSTRVLNVECPDRMGLVHRITGILLREGLNVVENQEFVDRPSNRFFMRTEVDGLVNEPRALEALRGDLGPEASIRLATLNPKRVVILASKEHHCVGDLLVRNLFNEMNSQTLCVVSNHETLRKLVEGFGLPFHFVPSEGKSREEHEAAVLQTLSGYEFDYLALAKYMRILSPAFVQRFQARMINIHHSFLPAFVGARPYYQAHQRGVKIIGATAHFVTESLDEGPIIVQDVIPVHTRIRRRIWRGLGAMWNKSSSRARCGSSLKIAFFSAETGRFCSINAWESVTSQASRRERSE
jgi:formyltetrahydrofolate deformylase